MRKPVAIETRTYKPQGTGVVPTKVPVLVSGVFTPASPQGGGTGSSSSQQPSKAGK